MRRPNSFALSVLVLGTFMFAVLFAQGVTSSSALSLQIPGANMTVKRIQVDAKSITALPTSKKYVVDLTQRGVKYEFDAKPGAINYGRVLVRTAKGEVTLSSYLEKAIRKDRLSEFKNNSLSFAIGSRPAATVQTQPNGVIRCGELDPDEYCYCTGEADCQIMLDRICKNYICSKSVPVYCNCLP
jgi:hypothetical protein